MDNCRQANADLIGTTWIGNIELLSDSVLGERGIVGVFASERSDALMADRRDQWSVELGLRQSTIVGAFRTRSENCILKNVLRYGGRAVWIVDRKLPTVYSKVCSKAFMEGRLLVVSCFWIDRAVYGAGGYCAELVQHLAQRLVAWCPAKKGFIPQVLRRARRNGKVVQVVKPGRLFR